MSTLISPWVIRGALSFFPSVLTDCGRRWRRGRSQVKEEILPSAEGWQVGGKTVCTSGWVGQRLQKQRFSQFSETLALKYEFHKKYIFLFPKTKQSNQTKNILWQTRLPCFNYNQIHEFQCWRKKLFPRIKQENKILNTNSPELLLNFDNI